MQLKSISGKDVNINVLDTVGDLAFKPTLKMIEIKSIDENWIVVKFDNIGYRVHRASPIIVFKKDTIKKVDLETKKKIFSLLLNTEVNEKIKSDDYREAMVNLGLFNPNLMIPICDTSIKFYKDNNFTIPEISNVFRAGSGLEVI